jgi:hypothetical protein
MVSPAGWVGVRSDARGLALIGPPPPGAAANESEARAAGAQLRNELMVIQLYDLTRNGTRERPIYLVYVVGRAAERIGELAPADTRRPLLHLLDDRDRFAAAHVLLTQAETPRQWAVGPWLEEDGWPDRLPATYNRLRFELELVDGLPRSPGKFDAAGRRAIRRYWHERLAVPVTSAPHWVVALAGIVLPICFVTRTVRRRRILGRGGCPQCGYDLRASPGRCPECGTSPRGAGDGGSGAHSIMAGTSTAAVTPPERHS